MKKTHKHLAQLLAGSAFFFSLSAPVLAEEAPASPADYALDEYVVTATRVPTKKVEIAAPTIVITREDIEAGHALSVPDALRKSNIDMHGTSHSTVPLLNGDDRVLVLVDGRRMNWSHLVVSGNSHAGFSLDSLPIQNVERIEVVQGPASSLYGSDAVGGVINIITRKAQTTQSTISSEFGSWNLRRQTLTSEGTNQDGLHYFFSAEKKKRGSYSYKDARTGETRVHGDTQLDQEILTLRLDQDLSKGRSLSFQFEHVQDNSGFGGAVNTDGSTRYPGAYRDSTDDNLALTYHYGQEKQQDNWLRLYRNTSKATYYNSLYTSSGAPYTSDLTANGLEWQQNWALSDKLSLVGGSEWRQEHLDDKDSIDRTVTTSAVFLESRWKLPKKWTFSVGSRYDHHSLLGGDITSRVSLNKEINEKTNAYISWGQYVKNPTLAELYSNTIYWLGNPNLKPETGDTLTLGLNTELHDGTKVQASVFHSNLKNAIDWKWNGITQYYNVDEEKRSGFNLNLNKRLSPQWSLGAGYSYVKIETKDDGATSFTADPRNSQPNGYRLNAQYTQDRWSGDLTLRSASGRNLQNFTSSSYLTLDLGLSYQLRPETRIYLKGYNLTNQAYEMTNNIFGAPGEYPMPGRNFYLGLEHKF